MRPDGPRGVLPGEGRGSTWEAKKVCLGCDVRGECLEYALQHDERFGIWGGLSERERRKLEEAREARSLPDTVGPARPTARQPGDQAGAARGSQGAAHRRPTL